MRNVNVVQMEELSDEGAVLLMYERDENDAEPILGTVGPLQFDVVQYRLKAEYGVAAIFDRLSYNHARWVEGTPFSLKHNSAVLLPLVAP